MNVYDGLKAAGVPLGNHESDLYALVNETSEAIVAGYKFKANVTRFRSQIDGRMWFDIPFAFEPWWAARYVEKTGGGAKSEGGGK